MTKSFKKQYYVVATKNGEHFYQEGDYTEQEINKIINDFDIEEFLADEATDEEFSGPEEGHYAIYRQSSMSTEEGLAIGYIRVEGDTYIHDYHSMTESQKQHYDKRCAEIEAEVELLHNSDGEPLVCLKQFAKVVA